jgi:DNA-directed RNA polymerase specialized sigma24 family protein
MVPGRRLEIAIETTSRALKYFIDDVLKAGRWDHRRGATLKTYFVGACLLQFPNVFDVWATEQRQWGQLHDSEVVLDDAVGCADPQWSDPTGDAAIRSCTARECLDGIPDAQTRRAAWMVFAQGPSLAETGAAVGLSAGSVERRLYRLRVGGKNERR